MRLYITPESVPGTGRRITAPGTGKTPAETKNDTP